MTTSHMYRILPLLLLLLGTTTTVAQDQPLAPAAPPVYEEGSEAYILQQTARLYRQHANLLDAKAAINLEHYEDLLDEVVLDLRGFLADEDFQAHPQLRTLYQSVVTEYETYYGEVDTLSIQRGDIYAFHNAMFTAMEDDDPLLEDVVMPAIPPMRTTVPMTVNRRVRQSIAYLKRTQDDKINIWRSRATTYFPMIEQIAREEGAPDELKYLALVESGLNPKARSWARAAGMWQFISATGKAYGLNVNSWVDERMDPEKATRAAIRHLLDLHRLFGGDWQLALAGYNCSPARVKRAVRRAQSQLGETRKATFWDAYPYLPRETRNYVPGFIAAALMVSNPEAFNLKSIAPGPRFEYDLVPVRHMLDLETIARMIGVEVSVIKAMNPELRRDVIPPTTSPYMLRIPLGTSGSFLAEYAHMEAEQSLGDLMHTVAAGQSLRQVARKYGVTTGAIKRANNLSSNTLQRGQRLRIPVKPYDSTPNREIAAGGARSVRFSTLTLYPVAADMPEDLNSGPAANIRSVATEAETRAAASSSSGSGTRRTHRVRRGETLSGIAKRYGVSLSKLRSWNNIRGSRIRVGQRLKIYGGKATASSKSSSAPKTVYHVVRRGDTLGKIARKYGTSVRTLKKLNGLRSNTIRRGQRLKVSGKASAKSTAKTTTYRVKRGDTLGKIASRNGVRVSDLKRWNNLRSSRIRVGQRLKIRK